MDSIRKYYPEFSESRLAMYRELGSLYRSWNQKVNLISRKDIDNIYTHHILHSLSIARFIEFPPGALVMDAGTGGGLPGLPLAIAFPEVTFYLVDSIGKKIRVVEDIIRELGLKNCRPVVSRAENVNFRVHYVISRAVTRFPDFYELVRKSIRKENAGSVPNGIIYLKGGDFEEELSRFLKRVSVIEISRYFTEAYFQTKKIIYLPVYP